MRFAATRSLAFLVAATATVCSASEPAAELTREVVLLQGRMAIGGPLLAELREARVRISALGRLASRDVAGLVGAIAAAQDGLSAWTHPDCAAARATARGRGSYGPDDRRSLDSAKTCEWQLRPAFGAAGLPTPSAEALLAGADLKPLLNAVSRRSEEFLQAFDLRDTAGSATHRAAVMMEFSP